MCVCCLIASLAIVAAQNRLQQQAERLRLSKCVYTVITEEASACCTQNNVAMILSCYVCTKHCMHNYTDRHNNNNNKNK